MTSLLLLVGLLLSFADSTQFYYAAKDTAALEHLCARPPRLQQELLCRYRLYPLTEDERYLRDLPRTLEEATAQELALLAGLWGYRAARAPFYLAVQYGLAADRLLKRAKGLDPHHPFVLLIEGQSLLFRPPLAGRSASAALDRFRLLSAAVRRRPGCGISSMEAELWTWYALHQAGDRTADRIRQRLLQQQPPPLYREFLRAPLRG